MKATKGKVILRTARLELREAVVSDARFFYRLMRQEEWIRFIGDRGIRRVVDAERYIVDRVVAGYRQNGFGMWVVTLRGRQGGIGICGLVNRDTLDAPDLGFAFLRELCGQGYALEAARATMDHGRNALGMRRILGITVPENARSIRLLERVGLRQISPPVDGAETIIADGENAFSGDQQQGLEPGLLLFEFK